MKLSEAIPLKKLFLIAALTLPLTGCSAMIQAAKALFAPQPMSEDVEFPPEDDYGWVWKAVTGVLGTGLAGVGGHALYKSGRK